ncbi:MAG: 50S ribosome-binding GTPase [Syntrophales bacterium]|nr:50S ribosome-binding GTPase [Syntrophales bacterium]
MTVHQLYPKPALRMGNSRDFDISWELIRSSGITGAYREIGRIVSTVETQLAALRYKKPGAVWVSFIGGTGTGKSTLFNALLQKKVSKAGVERPKTEGPVVYIHKDCMRQDELPFDTIGSVRMSDGDAAAEITGSENAFSFIEHENVALSHIIFMDAPDVDSIDSKNRSIAEAVYLLSDVTVFVTSQEKYADDIPSRFLYRLQKEGKTFFLLFNKTDKEQTKGEITEFYRDRNLVIDKDRIWLVPFLGNPDTSIFHQPEFQAFYHSFFQVLSPEKIGMIIKNERERSLAEIIDKMDQLLGLLEEEKRTAEKWGRELDAIVDSTWRGLVDEMKSRYEEENKSEIKKEVRRIFNKYDVLAKPRRYISNLISLPFRFLGFLPQGQFTEKKDEELLDARSKVDNSPIIAAMDSMNRSVFEKLSPADPSAPLFNALREEKRTMRGEEVLEKIRKKQEELAYWLGETFRTLAAGIPTGKKIGIYSASILWGTVILSFETVLGGGITLLEAAFDSVFAPFLTKGSVELFAYGELKRITLELNDKYEKALMSILEEQKSRYMASLCEVLTPDHVLTSLYRLRGELEESR